ncbi:MAG TPA: ATP-binding protein [Burkholderiaceae bacterium]|nr:ATP-binding protein [Burkholderiaceae bacterium]
MQDTRTRLKNRLSWLVPWLGASLLGMVWTANQTIDRQRALFETDARIVHRLLSQQVVQHDAILATLALLQPGHTGAQTGEEATPEQRLTALYPHILNVQRRDRDGMWSDVAVQQAESVSKQQKRAALANVDVQKGRFQLVLAAQPMAYALTIDVRGMVPWADWPMQTDSSPVRVVLAHDGQSFILQKGESDTSSTAGLLDWRFVFSKHLAAASQPFDVIATQTFKWQQLPWVMMLLWPLLVAAVLYVVSFLMRQRDARRRAEELLRLGQVARLNTLGELAAGMAHELNQPLSAMLANTQAAQRMLADTPPELDNAQHAMTQAVAQARRASEVVGRLRRAVEQPESGQGTQALDLGEVLRRAVYLLEPDAKRLGIVISLQSAEPVWVLADSVALDQIVHNLLMNAFQALERSHTQTKRLQISTLQNGQFGELRVADNGVGIPDEVLPRLFEPFFSTREGGLGLGLSLCETLAQGMGGAIRAENQTTGGAVFTLRLPLSNLQTQAV